MSDTYPQQPAVPDQQPGPFNQTGPIQAPPVPPQYPGQPGMPQPGTAWGQPGQLPPQYAAQPGAFPPGYAPAPVAPRAPSPYLQPDFWAAKLQLVALVALIGCAVGGIAKFIYALVTGGEYVSGAYKAYTGLYGLLSTVVIGVVACAAIMGLARLIQLVATKSADESKESTI